MLDTCLAVIITTFYLALTWLPTSLVAAVEFIGTIGVVHTRRNFLAFTLATVGWAFLNGALFVGYILLGYRIAENGRRRGQPRFGRLAR